MTVLFLNGVNKHCDKHALIDFDCQFSDRIIISEVISIEETIIYSLRLRSACSILLRLHSCGL